VSPLLPIVHKLAYREQPGRWKFVLTEDLVITFPKDFWGDHYFVDTKGTLRVVTEGRDFVILKGYAWDGSSFAINFDETLAASCWHDAAGQFRQLPCIAPDLPGALWNKRFAEIIEAQGAPRIASFYHFGLILGNPFYSAIGKLIGHKQDGSCLTHKK